MKVGDYVRTKNNGIKKILDIGEYLGMKQYLIDEDGTYTIDSSIIKSSPNIIDLIEVGDYVNGHKVIYTAGEKHKLVYVEYVNMSELLEVKSYQIKSIVTKGQIENCMYKVGD